MREERPKEPSPEAMKAAREFFRTAKHNTDEEFARALDAFAEAERDQLRARVTELEREMHESRVAWVEQQKYLRAQLKIAVEALEMLEQKLNEADSDRAATQRGGMMHNGPRSALLRLPPSAYNWISQTVRGALAKLRGGA